jgi:transposase
VLNGIHWRLRNRLALGADIPERYALKTTRHNHFMRWRKLGVWDKIFDAVSKAYEGDLQMVDASSIRVHQHATNVKKGPQEPQFVRDVPTDAWGIGAASV